MKKSGFLISFFFLSSFGYAQYDNSLVSYIPNSKCGTLSDRAEPRCDKFEEASSTDSILRYWLAPQTVNSNLPVSNTFYFWTSSRELDSVLSQKQLLRTVGSSDPLASWYLMELIRKGVNKNEEIAQHLFSGQRQRTRTAWPNYWATLTESKWDSVNDQLVQVVLMDSALIVKFSPDRNEKHRWKVFDLKGNTISMAEALLRKRHIAAVFLEGRRNVTYVAPRSLHIKDYYRTFILCNQDMIKSWHHAVPGMQAQIIQDLDYLLLMNSYFSEGWMLESQGRRGRIAHASWTMPIAEMKMNNYFFATQRYCWMTGVDANSEATIKILATLRTRWPLQKNPCERFPGKNPVYRPAGK
jgi:hypothetical protein